MNQYVQLVEELSINAWPSYQTKLYDGWLIRNSSFYTHRTHCVNIIGNSLLPIGDKITYCEQEYKRFKTPAIFRINPIFHQNLDTLLINRGYQVEHITDTYIMDLTKYTPKNYSEINVDLSEDIQNDWIQALFHLNKTENPRHLSIVPIMYEAIPCDTIAASIVIDKQIVATGLAIMERDHVGLYAIYVDPSHRNNNYAKAICNALLSEAKYRKYSNAYLQVVQNNDIAKQLYKSLGFQFFYTYWFRVKH